MTYKPGIILLTTQNTITICNILIISALTFGQNTIRESEGLFYDGEDRLYTGVYSEFYDNGNIKLEIPVRRGEKNGNVNIYYMDGSLNEIRSYRSGQMHGKWITWDEAGNKIAEAQYRKGEKHGRWMIWDEQGTIRYNMEYKNGDRKGRWLMFDENGKLVMEQTYD